MTKKNKHEINHHGLIVYKQTHPLIRQLKRDHKPTVFGTRTWETSWLMIDYLGRGRLPSDLNVLEVGCGWGLPGIFCAKKHSATVTGLDKDPAVFPYLHLHAAANQVEMTSITAGFESLTPDQLSGVDVLLGSEICFWDDMAGQVSDLIGLALEAGTRLILIADPGRGPFHQLEDHCLERFNEKAFSWSIRHPYDFQGRIIKIGSIH